MLGALLKPVASAGIIGKAPTILCMCVCLSLTCSHSNQDAWSALIRTQDLTPPVLTITDTPPPDFDSFYVIGHLDEAGTVYATLILSSEASTVTAAAACPPTFQVSHGGPWCFLTSGFDADEAMVAFRAESATL